MQTQLKSWQITLYLLAGLLVTLAILANTLSDTWHAITTPTHGFVYSIDTEKGEAHIKSVVPDGPADRAGVKAGDRILLMNKKRLITIEEFDAAFEEVQLGDEVSLTLVRDDLVQTISYSVERMLAVRTRTVLLRLLPGLIFCFALIFIGTFVFLKNIHQREARLFYLMLLAWAMAMMNYAFSLDSIQDILPDWMIYLYMVGLPMAVGFLLHFFLIFPEEKSIFKKYRLPLLVLAYTPMLQWLAFIVFNELGFPWAKDMLILGWGFGITLVFVGVGAALQHSIKSAKDANTRKQAEIMSNGTVWALMVPTALYFLQDFTDSIWLPAEYLALVTIIWPITLAYAIVRHRFMNIDVIIRRGLAYAVMSGFVIIAYFVLVVGLGQALVFLVQTESQLLTIIATLLIASLFNPVRNRVKEFVDKRFYPTRFAYREAVRAFSHQLVRIVDLQKLLNLVVDFLSAQMEISPVTVLWFNPSDNKFFIRQHEGLAGNFSITLTSENPVMQRLARTRELVDISRLRQLDKIKPNHMAEIWDALNAELVLPLLSRDKLVGVITLGLKRDGEPYFHDEIELIESLADQIQIAIENALLTDDLREQERMRKELELARKIQLSSLPQRDPVVAGLQVSGASIPALEVGGDYYDYFMLDNDRFGLAIGDVSGKGTSAALYMSQLKGMLQSSTRHHKRLREIANEINSLTFSSLETTSFITLTLATFQLNKQHFSCIRAGHLPVLYYSASDKSVELLQPRGIGIGLNAGHLFSSELEEYIQPYRHGDVFLFVTDGITEAQNGDGNLFDEPGVRDLLERTAHLPAGKIRDTILRRVREFVSHAIVGDDMTLVVVKCMTPQASA